MNNRESGMSIIEVLISVGILALLIPFALKMFFNTRQTQVTSDMRLNLRSITRTIETMVDCPNVPKTCAAGSLVAIPRRNGGTLITADGKTQLSSFTVRALCTGSNQFKVLAAKNNQDVATLFAERILCTSQQAAAIVQASDLIEVMAGVSCVVTTDAQLPCNPALPPACNAGYVSRGLSIDTFGGNDDTEVTNVFGQRWMRYCEKVP